MARTLIACSMLEDELRAVLSNPRCRRPDEIVWMERELHEKPALLRQKLQDAIDRACRPDMEILLAFGLCGNALDGVQARESKLVMPRFCDCIHMLRSFSGGSPGEIDARSLYLTRGWTLGSHSFLAQYKKYLALRGPERAVRAYRRMFQAYEALSLIDTGAYPLSQVSPDAMETASYFGLRFQTVPGTLRILEKLLCGPWDGEILVVPPGARVEGASFYPCPLF